MQHLLHLEGRYYFNRRVPAKFREFDSRKFVRFALNTDSKKEAARLSVIQNDYLEDYWRTLIQTGSQHEQSRYEAIAHFAHLNGFAYVQSAKLPCLPFPQVAERLLHVEQHQLHEKHVEAVLGGSSTPKIKLNDALEKFWVLARDQTLDKTPNQIRKWRNARKLAIKNFIKCVGNKPITELTRDDTLKFRDWWITRIEEEDLGKNSANKNFMHLKAVVETVNDNLKLGIDKDHIFKKLLLEEDDERRRLPFKTDYIRNVLLCPDKLSGLNIQARYVLYAIAETGTSFSELLGLSPEDIILDCDIPHIIIAARKKKKLKTKYRKRIIPLVGFALEAFRACPNGFTDYKDNPDSLSAALGKYLRENDLLPTDQHTVYSLRHSFQDRLIAATTPERIQADLMGHKFYRYAYGDGGTLEQKFEYMQKIQLMQE